MVKLRSGMSSDAAELISKQEEEIARLKSELQKSMKERQNLATYLQQLEQASQASHDELKMMKEAYVQQEESFQQKWNAEHERFQDLVADIQRKYSEERKTMVSLLRRSQEISTLYQQTKEFSSTLRENPSKLDE
uniref:Uncharacterized protein n=1 Tax=Guillardia theta TaxID=55529 RepID=A0A6U6EEE5_GUITH